MSIRRRAAQSGEVLHPPTGRSAKYGELAADAADMPVPESVALKRPEDFKLIRTPAKRLDTPPKVNGTAVYGIDVRPPGVKIATLAQSPVFGGRVKSVDHRAAKAVKGVRQIVRLEVSFLAHATMEPMNCTVHVREDGCEVWVGSQAVARAQAAARRSSSRPPGHQWFWSR